MNCLINSSSCLHDKTDLCGFFYSETKHLFHHIISQGIQHPYTVVLVLPFLMSNLFFSYFILFYFVIILFQTWPDCSVYSTDNSMHPVLLIPKVACNLFFFFYLKPWKWDVPAAIISNGDSHYGWGIKGHQIQEGDHITLCPEVPKFSLPIFLLNI